VLPSREIQWGSSRSRRVAYQRTPIIHIDSERKEIIPLETPEGNRGRSSQIEELSTRLKNEGDADPGTELGTYSIIEQSPDLNCHRKRASNDIYDNREQRKKKNPFGIFPRSLTDE